MGSVVPTRVVRWLDLAEGLLGDRRADAVLWATLVVTTVADVWLTVYGTTHGLDEGNPVAHLLAGSLGVAPVTGIVALKLGVLAVGAVCWLALPRRSATVVPFGLAVPTVAAVCNNLLLVALV
ncbi:MAG: DUF5658 family protein [Haloferacaceae archaeon]